MAALTGATTASGPCIANNPEEEITLWLTQLWK